MKRHLPPANSLPAQSRIELRLLVDLLGRARPAPPSQIYGPLADHFGLGQAERHAPRQSNSDSSDPAWNNAVRFAFRRLKDQGFVCTPVRGQWALTDRGREAAIRVRDSGPRFEVLTLEDLGL